MSEKYKTGEIREVTLNRNQVEELIRLGLQVKYPKAKLRHTVFSMFQNRWGEGGPIFSAILTLEKVE